MASVVTAVAMGMYGRRRTDFMGDFSYNKYHFGVYCHIAAAAGFMQARKLPGSYKLLNGCLFTGAVLFNSLPAYYEGFHEIRNEPVEPSNGLTRRIGFYMLVAGYAVIFAVGRGSFAGIKL